MKLKIEIDTNSAAIAAKPEEIPRILRSLADQIQKQEDPVSSNIILSDISGQTVGFASMDGGDPPSVIGLEIGDMELTPPEGLTDQEFWEKIAMAMDYSNLTEDIGFLAMSIAKEFENE